MLLLLFDMSVNGWSEQGTPRFICSDVGGDSANMVPNVYLGMPWPRPQPASPAMPTVTIGTSDFSIEFWARQKYGGSPGEDDQFWTGLLENGVSDFPDITAGIRWSSTDLSNQVSGAGGFIFSGLLATRRGVWNHWCINYDRSDLMTVYIDNESKGTDDISAEVSTSIAAQEVHALTSDHAFAIHSTDIDIDSGTYSVFPVVIGPFAIHKRLLTAAERESSYRSRTVQSLGAAVTLIQFGWRDFTGHTAWDMNQDNAAYGHSVGQAVPLGSPIGTNGTVKVLDLSGNANHWTIPTATDYAERTVSAFQAEAGTFAVAFGADPFFT